MTETVTAIPTDFYTEQGFIKSINMSSHPWTGETVVIEGKSYIVQEKAWDFDVSGIPLLVRIRVK
ncbi:MAG TPA: hypothetical protein VMS92_18950 [Mycobacterium sp.]|nr:hypothetical protein [Mycobacterium sp.]